MSEATLEAYVRQYIDVQPDAVEQIDFAFQGGEPTLMGLDFFRRVVRLQEQYAPAGTRIQNSLQTNGILLDDRWCEFLRRHNFLVGLSCDGPKDLHDRYRTDRNGRGTFDRVLEALERLRKHGVPFNVLCCVNRSNGDCPARVYRFFRDRGVEFLQFIPIVERRDPVRPDAETPGSRPESPVTGRSVKPKQYGRFLIGVFEEWIRHDVGRIFVRDFDQALAAWSGVGPSLCVHAEECGRAVAIEHNGDLYSCDHFVDPDHKLGNIHEQPIRQLANSARQQEFGRSKSRNLPGCCRQCEVRFACHGACPKDRFALAPGGEPGLNYLCAGYKMFFTHIDPCMRAMAAAIQSGRPASDVMIRLRREQRRARQGVDPRRPAGRNDPCPCGSGKKHKNCCLKR
jgi:uncharacterized protein